MSRMVPDRLATSPRRSSAPAFAMAKMTGESLSGSSAPTEDAERREQGAEIEAALKSLKVERKEAAYYCGHSDSTTIDKWIAGKENPHIWKLRRIPGFKMAHLEVQAVNAGCEVAVDTVITITRKRA